MVGTPHFFQTSEYLPEAGRVQLTLHVDVFSDRKGGRAIGFSASEGSELVAKYGGTGRALAGVPERHRRGSRLSDQGVYDEQ